MRKHIDGALKILIKVFADGTYCNMAFYGENASDMSTKLVYGVLEQNIKLEYILNSVISKKPQNFIFTLLKIGAYSLLNLTDVPDFAIVSECVEVAKLNGKGGASGFVNAVLKKIARSQYVLPCDKDENYLSVVYSKPEWFITKMIEQYGESVTRDMLSQSEYDLEHVRVNSRLARADDIKKLLSECGAFVRDSAVGGFVVRATDEVRSMFDKGLLTFQSPSSMLAVKALALADGASVLDVCSAPGGKAVYISELCRNSVVTACELHKHRLALIQKYKQRMHAPNVKTVLQDACVLREEWIEAFDFVLVDAPCSCFGTYRKHPDVFLGRGEKDISSLAEIQRAVIGNAKRYVKKGGVMVYSTCTLFSEENENIIEPLVSSREFVPEPMLLPFDNDGTLKLLPHGEWDGFFIARLRKL